LLSYKNPLLADIAVREFDKYAPINESVEKVKEKEKVVEEK